MRTVNRGLHELCRPGRRLALAGVLDGLVVALGCTSLEPMEPLGVNLVDLELQEITLFEATLMAKIRVSNPNPDPLQFSGGSLKLLVNDRDGAVELPAALLERARELFLIGPAAPAPEPEGPEDLRAY